jgi:Tol biopolymer transport system component
VTHDAETTAPVWAGSTLFYASRDRGAYEIWRRDEGTGAASRVFGAAGHSFPIAAAPDGSALAFVRQGETTRADLWLLPLSGGNALPLVQTPFEERAAAFSPDGALVAYQSNESGRWDVYVVRRADGRRTVASRAGGTRPLWAPDGASLYYQNQGDLMRVACDRGTDLRFGSPERAAVIGDADLIGIDGRGRLLIRRRLPQPTSLILVQHWTRDLRTILGPAPAFLPR